MKRNSLMIALMALSLSCGDGGQLPENGYSGVVEATTVNSSFEVTGLLARLEAREGATVEKGAFLAALDGDRLRAEQKASQARLAAARARLANLKAGARASELAQAEARVEQARADLLQAENGATDEELRSARQSAEAARQRWQLQGSYRPQDVDAARAALMAARASRQTQQRDFERYQRLEKEGAVSTQQFEQRRNTYDQAVAAECQAQDNLSKLSAGPRAEERESARAEYEAAQARYQNLANGTRPEQVARARAVVQEREQALELLREGSRPDDIKAAQAQVDEAAGSLAALEINLARTKLYADASGVVLSTNNWEIGENVPPGVPVVTVAELRHPWVTIYIPEPELTKWKLGQKARVNADGLKSPLDGKLIRIYEKAEFTPKFIQTRKERVNLVYRAKVEVDNVNLELRPGMPADVELIP